jgi:hypothetical protein
MEVVWSLSLSGVSVVVDPACTCRKGPDIVTANESTCWMVLSTLKAITGSSFGSLSSEVIKRGGWLSSKLVQQKGKVTKS